MSVDAKSQMTKTTSFPIGPKRGIRSWVRKMMMVHQSPLCSAAVCLALFVVVR